MFQNEGGGGSASATDTNRNEVKASAGFILCPRAPNNIVTRLMTRVIIVIKIDISFLMVSLIKRKASSVRLINYINEYTYDVRMFCRRKRFFEKNIS
jgi:hypothetical protein